MKRAIRKSEDGLSIIVPLTAGREAIVSLSDEALVDGKNWCVDSAGYAMSRIEGVSVRMHRFIMGKVPEGMVIDHINGDKKDNRRENLRICTQSQNIANSRCRRASSKYKGVYWKKDKDKWCANVNIDGKTTYLGYFSNEDDAARAYDAKALVLYGEFARLNFPTSSTGSANNV